MWRYGKLTVEIENLALMFTGGFAVRLHELGELPDAEYAGRPVPQVRIFGAVRYSHGRPGLGRHDAGITCPADAKHSAISCGSRQALRRHPGRDRFQVALRKCEPGSV